MRKYFKFLALTLLAILILWFFGRSLDWAEVWQSLRRADALQLTIATSIICLGYLLRAFRWRTLLAPITPSDLRELFATTTVGFAAVFLFGRMGEVVRPLWLPMRDKRVRPTAALVTIGLERIFDLGAIVLLFALNMLWFRAPSGREAEFAFVNQVGLLMLLGAILGFVCLIVFSYYSAPILSWLETRFINRNFVPQKIAKVLLNLLTNLSTSLQILRNPGELALVTFWTAALWFTISIPTFLVLTAFGLPLTFSDALFIMGWAAVGSLVPTPGGAAGAFHATTAAALVFMGVTRSDAAAVSIVMHLVYFAPALFFGIYYFLHGDISLQRLRSLVIADDSPQPESKLKNEKMKIESNNLRNATPVHSTTE